MNIYALATAAFCIIGGCLAIYVCVSTFMRSSSAHSQKHTDNINKNLEILKGEKTEKEKAKAFVALMNLSYVLVHTLVNHSNKYDDQVQVKYFCDSMTPSLIEKLNAVKGNRG